MIRVVSGTAGGLLLKTLPGDNTRPTLDRVKEPMFSMINDLIPGSWVLDLFAGTGALGIEALSRGAQGAVLGDTSREAVSVIRANLAHTKLEDKARVVMGDYKDTIVKLSKEGKSFEIVFVDPPYDSMLYTDVLKRLASARIIRTGSLVVCEHRKEDVLPKEVEHFTIDREKTYGTVALTIYKMGEKNV